MGKITNTAISSENSIQFDKVLFLTMKNIIVYMVPFIKLIVLKMVLLFLFINGRFFVSAGAKKANSIIEVIANTILTLISIYKVSQRYGTSKNIILLLIQQSILLLACTPNTVNLNIV